LVDAKVFIRGARAPALLFGVSLWDFCLSICLQNSVVSLRCA
jgi:hypothetical protein